MKATLKHIKGQYILIVDERPNQFDFSLNINNSKVFRSIFSLNHIASHNYKIIAAENLERVKGIKLLVDDTLISDKDLINDLLREVTFEEVEVEEHEDYYLVKL